MGTCASQPVPVVFSLSVAPTVTNYSPKRVCCTCGQVITSGSLHLSRVVPPTSVFCIMIRPDVLQHYDFDHGMHAAAMVPCGKHTSPPTFSYATVFSVVQERRARVATRHAVGLWQARKDLLEKKPE